MFGFSIWEIFLILVIALLVVGPERLPGLARTVGTWVHKIKKFVANAKAELDSEFNFQDMKDLLNSQESEIAKLRALVEETRQEVSESGRQVLGAVDDVESSFRAAARSEQESANAPLKAEDGATPNASDATVSGSNQSGSKESGTNKPATSGVDDGMTAHSPQSAASTPSVPLSFEEEIRLLEESSGQPFKRPFEPSFEPTEPAAAPASSTSPSAPDTADASKVSSPKPDSKTS